MPRPPGLCRRPPAAPGGSGSGSRRLGVGSRCRAGFGGRARACRGLMRRVCRRRALAGSGSGRDRLGCGFGGRFRRRRCGLGRNRRCRFLGLCLRPRSGGAHDYGRESTRNPSHIRCFDSSREPRSPGLALGDRVCDMKVGGPWIPNVSARIRAYRYVRLRCQPGGRKRIAHGASRGYMRSFLPAPERGERSLAGNLSRPVPGLRSCPLFSHGCAPRATFLSLLWNWIRGHLCSTSGTARTCPTAWPAGIRRETCSPICSNSASGGARCGTAPRRRASGWLAPSSRHRG